MLQACDTVTVQKKCRETELDVLQSLPLRKGLLTWQPAVSKFCLVIVFFLSLNKTWAYLQIKRFSVSFPLRPSQAKGGLMGAAQCMQRQMQEVARS